MPSQGRDDAYPITRVHKGREFRSWAAYQAFLSDGKAPQQRLTNSGRRPARRRPT